MKNKPEEVLQLHSRNDEPSQHMRKGTNNNMPFKNKKAVSKPQLLNQKVTCTSILVLPITLLKKIFIKQTGRDTPFSRQKIHEVFLFLHKGKEISVIP